MTADLAALRAVAETATTGEWRVADDGEGLGIYDVEVGDYLADLGPDVRRYNTSSADSKADATHIATFDPPTVLALLDRLERAEAAVSRIQVACVEERDLVDRENKILDPVTNRYSHLRPFLILDLIEALIDGSA